MINNKKYITGINIDCFEKDQTFHAITITTTYTMNMTLTNNNNKKCFFQSKH